METFFTIGLIWYLFITFWAFLLFHWVAKEYIFWSGFNIAVYVLFLIFVMKKDLFGSIAANPYKAIIFTIVYFVLGFSWSFVKWWLFVNKEALRYKIERMKWLQDRVSLISIVGLDKIDIDTKVPEELIKDWKSSCWYPKMPKVLEYKKSITHWVLYWPVSVVLSLFEDFISKITQLVVIKIRFAYEHVAKNAFKNTEE